MQIRRIRSLCVEIFKSLNDLNAPYMKELFIRNESTYNLRSCNDLSVPRINQTTFGLRSIRYEDSVMWNHLPNNIKNAGNIEMFKKLIKNWNSPQCKCTHCRFVNGAANYST